jgi:hypothetical protein
MGDFLEKGVTFQSGSQLTHTDLNNLVDNAVIKNNAIGYAQLKDGSIAESVFGFPVISDEDVNDSDYYLIWSATHSGFRKIKKSVLANSLQSLVSDWFNTFFTDKAGEVLPTLTEPVQDTLQFEGNIFDVKAKYEQSSGRINLSGRLASAEGVILLNTWALESEYSGNKLTFAPDQDNTGGDPEVDIIAQLKARTKIELQASNGNQWTVESSKTLNEFSIEAHSENSGGAAKVRIKDELQVEGNAKFSKVTVDEITRADGTAVGGTASFFSVDGTNINFGSDAAAYVYDDGDGDLYLNSGSLGSAQWTVTGSTLTIDTTL